MFDLVDGPIGHIAWIAGTPFHGLVLLLLHMTGSENLDMVPYNMLRLGAGYLLLIGLLCVPLAFLIGWWTLAVAGALIMVLIVLAGLQ